MRSFSNHGYFNSAILEALYDFKVKRAHKAKDSQFIFQNNLKNGLQDRCFPVNLRNLTEHLFLQITSRKPSGSGRPVSYNIYL